jgi:hypothetical protein
VFILFHHRHWEEKDCLPWFKQEFGSKFEGDENKILSCTTDAGSTAELICYKLEQCNGEAHMAKRKGNKASCRCCGKQPHPHALCSVVGCMTERKLFHRHLECKPVSLHITLPGALTLMLQQVMVLYELDVKIKWKAVLKGADGQVCILFFRLLCMRFRSNSLLKPCLLSGDFNCERKLPHASA